MTASAGSPRVRIGTSGFSYKEWKGVFYPEKIKNDAMLAYYAERLDTVEINNTFHRMPRVEMLETWAGKVPENFSFVLKAPRHISHKKGLEGVAEPLATFAANAGTLGLRLGPALFQFPPWFKKDFEILTRLTAAIPDDFRCAMEFRHESWFDDATYEFLSERRVALVVSDQKLARPPVVKTAPFGYVRFRQDGYSDEELTAWAAKLKQTDWDEVYVFFKHEDAGAAPRMAARFREVFS
jgi:uncharacterized protein YecE (DUF72 family)